MSIGFLSPWALLAAAAVAVPLVIHLLQRRREVILPFPMVRFVLLARKRSSRRLKLKKLFLLALRMAAILLAALILARPVLRSTASDLSAQGGYTALVVDNSLSTAARMGEGTVFETLLDVAAEVVRRGGSEGKFALFTAVRTGEGGGLPDWVPGEDVLAALRGSGPLPGRGNFTRAFEEAYAALREAPAGPRQIVVLTDLAEGSWSEFSLLSVAEPDPSVPVNLFRAGEAAGGAGVVSIAVEGESFVAGEDLRVEGRVVNWGPGERVAVELIVDGSREDRKILTVPAGTEGKVTFEYRPGKEGGRRIEIRLPEDAYSEDDRRRFGLNLSAPLAVLVVDGDPGRNLVDSETFFVREALRGEGMSRIQPLTVRGVSAEELARLDLASFDVIVLANVAAPERGEGMAEFLSSGGGLAVFWGTNCRWEEYSRALPSALPARLSAVENAPKGKPFKVTRIDFEDPVFRVFSPPGGGTFSTSSFFRRARAEDLTSGASVPASFHDGQPWAVSAEAGKGRVLLFSSTADLAWNDLPTKPVFVPLMRRAVLFLAGRLGVRPGGEVTAGDAYLFKGGEKDAFAEVAVTAPDGTVHRLEFHPEAGGISASLTDTMQVGFHEWSGPAGEGVLAVNPPPEESVLRRMEEGEVRSRFQGVPLDLFAVGSEEGGAELSQAGARNLSQPLFLALLLLLVLEMAVAGPRARLGRSSVS